MPAIDYTSPWGLMSMPRDVRGVSVEKAPTLLYRAGYVWYHNGAIGMAPMAFLFLTATLQIYDVIARNGAVFFRFVVRDEG